MVHFSGVLLFTTQSQLASPSAAGINDIQVVHLGVLLKPLSLSEFGKLLLVPLLLMTIFGRPLIKISVGK